MLIFLRRNLSSPDILRYIRPELQYLYRVDAVGCSEGAKKWSLGRRVWRPPLTGAGDVAAEDIVVLLYSQVLQQ
jgi:hypothetical protein